MNKTTMLLIGGLAVAGIFLIVAVGKESKTAQAAPSPAAVPPLQVPQFPPAPPLPQFQVDASPTYMYFNVAPNRNLLPTKKNEGSGDGCGCGNCDDGSLVAQLTESQTVVNANAKKLAQRFTLGPNPSAMLQQFPPALYPWLYQNGGTT